MSTTVHKNLVVLARVLERLECSPVRVDAEQYRAVVDYLAAELEVAPRDAGLEMLLENFPATAQLYENLHYQHAGLCRSPLQLSIEAEAEARCAILQARGADKSKRASDS